MDGGEVRSGARKSRLREGAYLKRIFLCKPEMNQFVEGTECRSDVRERLLYKINLLKSRKKWTAERCGQTGGRRSFAREFT